MVSPMSPKRKSEGRGRYKKRKIACNERYSPSKFGVVRKNADLYHSSLIVRSVRLYERGRSEYC